MVETFGRNNTNNTKLKENMLKNKMKNKNVLYE